MCIIEEMKKACETAEHRGYYYRLSHIIEILIMGLLCRLQTLKAIHGWAESRHVREMLEETFGMRKIPCYSHFTNLVGMIDSEALNKIFMEFFQKLVHDVYNKTISFDGKTICTTANMKKYQSPLHIASAFVVQNGITIGQLAVADKSNEIPAVQDLIKLLNIEGAIVVADALNCQKKTAEAVLGGGADYLLKKKKNHPNLYEDVSEMVDFKLNDKVELRTAPMDKSCKAEKGHGRIDKRIAYVTHEVEWLQERDEWVGLKAIGAVISGNETRYYISSRKLSAADLLEFTRQEWMVESMHWQLDVLFNEDRTTLHDENAQKTLNILRKTVLNIVRTYRDKYESKRNMTDIMRKCLFDTDVLIDVIRKFNNCIDIITN
jgi:predicted transposase YbfD/YdcC